MSEIEKLYENANVEKQQTCSHSDTCYNGSLNECEGCNAYKSPEFTAEKQLELIKWLTKRTDFALGYYPSRNIWVAKTEFCWEYYEKTYEHKETEQALAGLINTLWQDLEEEEKEEIKEILK